MLVWTLLWYESPSIDFQEQICMSVRDHDAYHYIDEERLSTCQSSIHIEISLAISCYESASK